MTHYSQPVSSNSYGPWQSKFCNWNKQLSITQMSLSHSSLFSHNSWINESKVSIYFQLNQVILYSHTRLLTSFSSQLAFNFNYIYYQDKLGNSNCRWENQQKLTFESKLTTTGKINTSKLKKFYKLELRQLLLPVKKEYYDNSNNNGRKRKRQTFVDLEFNWNPLGCFHCSILLFDSTCNFQSKEKLYKLSKLMFNSPPPHYPNFLYLSISLSIFEQPIHCKICQESHFSHLPIFSYEEKLKRQNHEFHRLDTLHTSYHQFFSKFILQRSNKVKHLNL